MKLGVDDLGFGCAVISLFLFVSSIAAWVTHVIRCFNEEQWGFLIAGAIAFPIAVIHGWLIWFGVV